MAPSTDPSPRSFVPVPPGSHFPLRNLPLGVFQPAGSTRPRVGVAIGEMILDLSVLEARGLLDVPAAGGSVFERASLNAFLALGRETWRRVRADVTRLLSADEPALRDDHLLRTAALVPMAHSTMRLPVEIGDYTDFYASKEHATNVGAIVRGPENALPPNWLHLPIAYHGRASSVVVSGTDVRRPRGQRLPQSATVPEFGPTAALDFELEMGAVIGAGNAWGEPIPVERAWEHVFGLVLVNDWSARDIQKWEYVPLGPFLSKSFATSISPWIVPLDALAPFAVTGPPQDPPPLDYLRTENRTFDVHLEVRLEADSLGEPVRLCESNLRHLYWSIAQQVAHHTVGGCNLRTGDLLATGTISGPAPGERGCLLELTEGGRSPLALPNGRTRRYLDDGDRVTMTGYCQDDEGRIGFGEVTGRVLPPL
jgi:fumarylacetoacetase